MITSLTDMRARRVMDELEDASRLPLMGTMPDSGAQVLCGLPSLNAPIRSMAEVYHVRDQKFLVQPTWCEFTEAKFHGDPLRDMVPTYFEIGSRLFLECTMRWDAASGEQDGHAVTFKSGAYTIKSAVVMPYGVAESDPANSEGPPDLSITPSLLDHDWIRRFRLGTIGDKSVELSKRGYAYMSGFEGAYDVQLISNF